MIKVENVSFSYERDNLILDDLCFNVYDGEILAIVGKNGSGKSTIGKIISGITRLKKGNVFIDNLNIKEKRDYAEIRKRIGIVSQNPENQIIFNNIYDEISFSLKDLKKEEINSRIHESLEKVEMINLENKDLYNLSLGQKQRVMIAEILSKSPKYIIFDEPTTMIDTTSKEKIYEIIKKLKQQGHTIIYITNIADEIILADRTLILENGKVAKEIKREDLINEMQTLQKYSIKMPTILEIVYVLKEAGINIELEDYTISELLEKLKGKLKHEKHI